MSEPRAKLNYFLRNKSNKTILHINIWFLKAKYWHEEHTSRIYCCFWHTHGNDFELCLLNKSSLHIWKKIISVICNIKEYNAPNKQNFCFSWHKLVIIMTFPYNGMKQISCGNNKAANKTKGHLRTNTSISYIILWP